jgi:membrane-associated phospholipid phosphatase
MNGYTFVDYATQGYLALSAALILCFHNATVVHWSWLVAIHFGLSLLIHVLVFRRSKPGVSPAVDFLGHFYPVLLYTFFYAETGWLNRMFFSHYLDPVVARADQTLFGFQPGIRFMERLPYLLVSEVFYAAYFSYYLMIGGIGLALFLRDRKQFFHYVSVISFVFYLCYVAYIVLPVVGPRVFLKEIPGYSLPDEWQRQMLVEEYPATVTSGVFFRLMAFIYRIFESPGAAFPSSHVAVAVTTVWFSFRYLPVIRFPHLVAAVLLCLATVYCRYHYAVDVLAGLLTAAVLVPLGNRLYSKTVPQEKLSPGPRPESQTSRS